ncbi:MAG: peptidylprolyl isomerase, partial [Rhodocyclaceae bacterium]|nr:peptidylprolyl isomerase [Rhodocyclaceae bacterium]
GQIGAGGYYPSYEEYILALDKGWHVAPTNNQDNHKGRWGNAILEFTAPDGSRYPGLLTELHEDHALIDFNHPLAGKTILFEATIIGITNNTSPA